MRSLLIAVTVLAVAATAAILIARPEPVPAVLKPPERSAASQQKAVAETGEAIEVEPDPADEPPHPGYSLSRQDLEQGLLKVRTRAMSCHDEATPPELTITLTISTSGTVTGVALPQEMRGTPAGDCLVRALKTATFPSWAPTEKVTQVEWRYPLRFDGVE